MTPLMRDSEECCALMVATGKVLTKPQTLGKNQLEFEQLHVSVLQNFTFFFFRTLSLTYILTTTIYILAKS